jgi:hypothetical protein
MELGVAEAARKVEDLPLELVIAGLAQHARGFDAAQVSAYETSDGTLIEHAAPDVKTTRTIGEYHIVATREGSWDAISRLLSELSNASPEFFDRVMHGVRAMSDRASRWARHAAPSS